MSVCMNDEFQKFTQKFTQELYTKRNIFRDQIFSRMKQLVFVCIFVFCAFVLSSYSPYAIRSDQSYSIKPKRGIEEEDYVTYFHKLLWSELGPVVTVALYDPWFFRSAIRLSNRSEDATEKTSKLHADFSALFPEERNLPWSINHLALPPVRPYIFTKYGVGGMMLFLKQTISLGFGRIAHDGRLAAQFAKESSLKSDIGLPMERSIRTMVRAYLSYAMTFIQLVIDGENRLPDLSDWHKGRAAALNELGLDSNVSGLNAFSNDPMLIMLQALRPSPTIPKKIADQQDCVLVTLQRIYRVIDSKTRRVARSSSASVGIQRFEAAESVWAARHKVLSFLMDIPVESGCKLPKSLLGNINEGQFAVTYTANTGYGVGLDDRTRNGRFWNSIRPVVGCSSLAKQCEEYDGCRYFCNLNYLMGAVPTVPSGVRGGRYGHQVVGFGSNNEYEWEVGLAAAFHKASKRRESSVTDANVVMPNTIGRFTVFDCTVKKWTPPSALVEGGVGFGHASFCLDQESNVGLGSTQSKVTFETLSFGQLKTFLLSNGQSVRSKNLTHDPVQRYTLPKGIITRPGNLNVPFVDFEKFDEISILKLDIEGFEHRTFPNMVVEEIKDIARSSDGDRLIFFDKGQSTPTVSHLQIEFHRAGHATGEGSKYIGALRAHYTLMHLFASGYVMFAQEKNPFDACCFEIALTHYRYYIRSEAWMTAGHN